MGRLKKEKKIGKNSVVLVHYKNKKGENNFKLGTIEKMFEIKEKLINEGMSEVDIPILKYIDAELYEEYQSK